MFHVAGLGLAVGAVCAVVSLGLVLRFLRHVYDKGGPADLKVAASAVRTARAWWRWRSTPNRADDESQPENAAAERDPG